MRIRLKIFCVALLFLLFSLPAFLYADPPQFDLFAFSPSDGATGVSLTPTLSWSASDPDPVHTLTYDIYFGTELSPPLVLSNQTGTSYQPGQLSSQTTYYWKIVARDNLGSETPGPILLFTTLNNPPQFIIANFSPPDGATGVSQTTLLSWAAEDPDPDDSVVYDIYFGTSPSPPLVASDRTAFNYLPGQLSHMTVYYWKIVARDTHGAETQSQILTFTTRSNPPSFTSFFPANMSTGITLTTSLSWSAYDPDPDDTLVYDIYFGASSPPPLVSSNQTGTSYQPGLLSYATRYYWRIVARDNHGTETSIAELYFNTQSIDIIVDRGTENVSYPQVTAAGDGHVYVVWQDSRNGGSDIYFNYSTDYGVTWQSSDIRLDKDAPGSNNSTFPKIACDNSGHVYVVWQDDRDDSSDVYFNVSSDYGVTWLSSDKKLSTVPHAPPAQAPKVACDNNGHVYVAWDDNYFNTSADYGATWLTQPTHISPSGGIGTQLTCDQNGHVYVAWRSSDVLFNYSSDYGITWQSSDIIISDSDALPYFLSLDSDENGNVFVAWHDGRNNPDSPDIYFNSSSNYGNTWGAADLMLNKGTPGATYSIWPEVACDETGHVYVAWYDGRNGLGDIYLNFSSDYGTNWQTSDVRLDTDSPGAVDSGYPEIAIDASGYVYVVWDDNQASVGGPGMYMNYSLDYGTSWLSTNKKVGYSGGLNPRIMADSNSLYIVRDNSDIVFSRVAIYLPVYPSPADKATQVSLIPALRWRGGTLYLDNTLTYDVYFGTSSPPPLVATNLSGTTYIPGILDYFTTYYWKVVSRDSSGVETPGPIWSFTTVSNPPQLNNFSPPDGAINVAMINPTLSWTATDPNPGDTLTYDIYLGTAPNPPLKVSNQSAASYQAGLLYHMTRYYWKIVARDNHGSETAGPILSFTTLDNPPQFDTFSPPDGRIDVSLTPTLSWVAHDSDPGDILTYDIYFGTSSSPPLVLSNQTVTSYQPGQLSYLTVYYWKIVVRDDHGAVTESPVRSFRTISTPPTLSDFSPPDMTIDVIRRPILTWNATDPDQGDILSYDIYFGTSPSPPRELTNSPFTNYNPGILNYATRYYWKIVAFDKYGAKTVGPVLSFVTANPPQIVTIEPNPCRPKEVISIIGMRFGDTQGTSEIHLGKRVFGPGSARIKYWSDSRIDFRVPPYTAWLPGATKTLKLWVRKAGFNSINFPLTISKP